MATTSIEHLAERACEAYHLHAAWCRYRKQGLVCSICVELAERAERAQRIRHATVPEVA